MGLKAFLRSIFGSNTESVDISGKDYASGDYSVQLKAYADYICKSYIANAVAQCEMRTFIAGKELFGAEYYRWNIAPNNNQSAAEFKHKMIFKLYENMECLIVPVGKQLFVADSFGKNQNEITPIEFTGITIGNISLNRTYTSMDAIYIRLDEDISLTGMLSPVAEMLGEALSSAAEKYNMDGGERGTLTIDAIQMGDEDYATQINNLLDKDFKKYFQSRNAVLPMYNGTQYTPIRRDTSQNTSVVSDIQSLINEAVAVTAQAYGIPSALLAGNVADTQTAQENFISGCIKPLMQLITQAVNKVLYGQRILSGSYISADLSNLSYTDIFRAAEKIDKLYAASVLTANEIRRKIGEPSINEDWANQYARTKNYEVVNGKEENEE